MFSKVLIANRGEVAVRIIRACRELGIRTVAVHSEADRTSLHVRLADEAVCIGPAATSRSYLNMPNIVMAALMTGADAIHPGTGFLAERHIFAEVCARYQITFIGPHAETIERLGDKTRARKAMREAGLSVMPGSSEPMRSLDDARALAESLGYPVMLKAVEGGGGMGIRLLRSEQDLVDDYAVAQAEAERAFGHPGVYLEKYVEDARHTEVQILGDQHGNVVHIGERDCSLQRRQQKLLEEAPAVGLSTRVRDALRSAAVQGARAVGYVNAGTWEFLVDRDDNIYFMEVNTRIQVEHPVTEAISGLDLVRTQLLIAAGQPLPWRQKDIRLRGHAMECRINAEDPSRGFAPDPGQVLLYLPPGGPGVRVDSHLYSGYHVPPHYDPLLAKVITWGANREEARERMKRALAECMIEGVATTIPFHRRLLDDPAFIRHDVSTKFVERWLPTLSQAELSA
ncbi:MAG TPA: acetyl-CoA carboxylase biotin carboxylase subunit [Chloroflexota bacterium]|nr:acetyl-CoA carboxylase biotin carboxylase subunit [Chloroflexota bacterium]